MVLIFGGFGHDDDDHNLMPVDSTPVNCGEENTVIILTPKGGILQRYEPASMYTYK